MEMCILFETLCADEEMPVRVSYIIIKGKESNGNTLIAKIYQECINRYIRNVLISKISQECINSKDISVIHN